MKKGLLIVGFWVVVTPLLMELAVRLAVPALPLALQVAAQRVQQGEALVVGSILYSSSNHH